MVPASAKRERESERAREQESKRAREQESKRERESVCVRQNERESEHRDQEVVPAPAEVVWRAQPEHCHQNHPESQQNLPV